MDWFVRTDMAKRVTAIDGRSCKFRPPRKATARAPCGSALGQHGVNIMDFCKAFNAKTSAKDQEGLVIPVVITVYHDRTLHLHHQDAARASILLKARGGHRQGVPGEPNRNKAGR